MEIKKVDMENTKVIVEIMKGSHHSKITGNFGELLVLYWLSKHGFECAVIDHVGLDIIARNLYTNELMGISVKSRSRNPGTEGTHINIPKKDIPKLEAACQAFGCKPYFALVVDEADTITVFILSKSHLEELYPKGEKIIAWMMNKAWQEKYEANKEIKIFTFKTETLNWWSKTLESI